MSACGAGNVLQSASTNWQNQSRRSMKDMYTVVAAGLAAYSADKAVRPAFQVGQSDICRNSRSGPKPHSGC
jgi:hypothetical protein